MAEDRVAGAPDLAAGDFSSWITEVHEDTPLIARRARRWRFGD